MTLTQRIEKVASEMRKACIAANITRTPDQVMIPWNKLPLERKERWRTVAAVYVHLFQLDE